MFVARKNLMSSVVYLSSLLVCCQLYPMHGETDQLYDNYDISLAKKDASSALKDSLISALLMSDFSKAGSPSQRKKAVDSTFIRFGRSSMPQGVNKPPSLSLYEGNSHQTEDLDYQSPSKNQQEPVDNVVAKEIGQSSAQNKLVSPFQSQHASLPEGCLIKNKNDLYMVLMGKMCSKTTPKVKRENVNDTFIRFGKREIPNSDRESDREIKYGR